MFLKRSKQPDKLKKEPVSAFRLRFGVSLWLVSWIPFPVIFLFILQGMGYLQDPQQSTRFLTLTWSVQICVGLIGVWIGGKEAILLVKAVGWKSVPKVAWRIIRYGRTPSANQDQ